MKQLLTILLFSTGLFACVADASKSSVSVSDAVQVDDNPGSCPYLTKDQRNNVVLSWVKERDTTTSVFCYAVSADGGKTFGKPVEIPGSTNVHPHGENLPKLLFKPSGEIIAAWGTANPSPKNKYAGLVYYSQSFDEGKTWTKPKGLTTDTASFDQRYFDMALLPSGEAAIVWLDNRKNWQKEGSGLYYATTSGLDGFQNEKRISGPCCQCCRTDLFIDKTNNIHVLYRAILDNSIRDMVHIVSTDNGNSFSKPVRISRDEWKIEGCPHTGPAMAENQDGLHFTWFTGGEAAGIYYNQSKDLGASFSARDEVSGKTAKHCQIASGPNDNILIVWNENVVDGSTVSSRIGIEQRGASGQRLYKDFLTPEGSNSSFPVIITSSDHRAVVAYTESINNKEYVQYKRSVLK